MYVIATLRITDSKKFFEFANSIKNSVPANLKPYFGLPSTDGKQMICMWESPSIDQVRNFLDKATQGVATNSYYEIDQSKAMDLQEQQNVQRAA